MSNQQPTNAYRTNVVFEDGEWWYKGNKDGGRRRIESHIRKNEKRMWANHHYIPVNHPLHKPGHYKSFGECAFQTLVKKERALEGYVYLVASPSFPGWVKVGCAIDAEDRCASYQTSSPYRDYELLISVEVEDRAEAERDLLATFAGLATDRRGEWFEIPTDSAIDAFKYWSEAVCI